MRVYCRRSMEMRALLAVFKPEDFLALVGLPDPERKTPQQLAASFKHFARQGKVGPLWLRVRFYPVPPAWQIIDHDGRHRCLYLLEQGQKSVEVIVEPTSGSPGALLESMMTKGLMSDYTDKLGGYKFIKPLEGGRI